jgi:uncharacterized protein YkwD
MPASRAVIGRMFALTALLTFVAIAPASAVSSRSYESQVVDRTNHHRSDHHKAKVKTQTCVDRWAESQAKWMAETKTLQHRPGRLQKVLKDCKLTGASENIAYGYSSGNKTVNAWMRSSGHRKNVLSGTMRYVGVGAVKKNGVWWVAQVFGTRK